MKTQIIFSILLYTFCCYSQKDTLNKYNDKKKKTGYWVEYFDQNVLPSDSADAFFYGFQFYDNGKKVYSFHGLKEKRRRTLIYDSILPKKGYPVPVNGVFKWYYKDSTLRFEEEYNKGFPSIYKVYYQRARTDNSIVVTELLDFKKKYNNIPGTFYYEIISLYSESPTLKFWYYKDKKGWDFYKIK